MEEFFWIASEIMQEHLQNLMSQGYMTTVELVTYHVPEGPASPISMGGGDMSWHVQRSMSGDSVCHHTNFFALCCSSMT
jgi:hypothetical protein